MSQAGAILLAVSLTIGALPALAKEPRVTPPKRFDHPAVNTLVVERTPQQIRDLCSEHSPWASGVGACALPGKRCIILWPKGKARAGLLWRHERAHCNGWPADHPG